MYTAEDLVASLRRYSLIPTAAAADSLSTSDLIDLMSDELQTYVLAEMMKLREEFSIAEYLLTTTDGTARYSIPPRAIGSKLKDIFVQRGSGWTNVHRIEPEQGQQLSGSGGPLGYYLEDTEIVFVPDPGTTVIKITYPRRPNRLIRTDACGTITAIDTGTKTVTVDLAPTTFTSSETYDIIQAEPHFKLRSSDATATVSGNDLTFSALPDGLEVGDYICLAGQSPVPMIPVEAHSFLAQRTAFKALGALGDPKASVAKAMCDESLKSMQIQLGNRVEDQSRRVINRNGPGWRRFSWRR